MQFIKNWLEARKKRKARIEQLKVELEKASRGGSARNIIDAALRLMDETQPEIIGMDAFK